MDSGLRAAFGTRVRTLREKQGFSQEGFALHCGLHRTYMGGIERGERNPTLESMAVIARGLGMTISALTKGLG